MVADCGYLEDDRFPFCAELIGMNDEILVLFNAIIDEQ